MSGMGCFLKRLKSSFLVDDHLWLKHAFAHIFQPHCSINPVSERFHAVQLVIKMAWKRVGHKAKENGGGITWPEFNFIIKCWKDKGGAHFQEFNNVQNQILPHRDFWQSLRQEITFSHFFLF